MSKLCSIPDCHLELTHIHGTGSNMDLARNFSPTSLHERQLYVYPRGPGDAPGNQWVCSCGGPWPCPEAKAMDSIAAAKAHPAAHADAKWRNVTDPRYALTDTLLADLATCRKLGIEALDRYEADLTRERSARIAAEEDRDKWKSCYQTQEIYLAKIEGILTEAEAENKRLSQALSYERDEYGQYREAHPWATHALSSDECNCRCGAPWPCPVIGSGLSSELKK